MIRLKLTVHFQGRMVERGIDIDHVKEAIEHPDKKVEYGEGQLKVERKIGSKTITVIYSGQKFRDKHGEFVVITAYYN